MENLICDLVDSYEEGALSRRQLIQRLAMLAGAGAAGTSAVSAFQTNTAAVPAMQASTIDHVSIQVKSDQASCCDRYWSRSEERSTGCKAITSCRCGVGAGSIRLGQKKEHKQGCRWEYL